EEEEEESADVDEASDKDKEGDEVKEKEALDDWVDVTKEVDAIAEKAGDEEKSENKAEDDDDEEESEEEEEDDNPYRLIFQDEDGEYEDIDGDVLIKDLLEGGEVIITLK
ncbi:hypothetical protein LPJ71_002824, partial [Coemansia sp. S17]